MMSFSMTLRRESSSFFARPGQYCKCGWSLLQLFGRAAGVREPPETKRKEGGRGGDEGSRKYAHSSGTVPASDLK